MNETMNTILSRRSTRKFQQDQIKDDELELILNAGKFAPTAFNQQPWHFTVVQNKEILEKIAQVYKEVLSKSGNPQFEAMANSKSFSPFYNAPTFIMVTADEKALAPIYDGTLALGNMLLAAESLNIGACWLHAINYVFASEESKKLKEELGIPKGYIAVGSAAFGYKEVVSTSPAPRKENTVTIIK